MPLHYMASIRYCREVALHHSLPPGWAARGMTTEACAYGLPQLVIRLRDSQVTKIAAGKGGSSGISRPHSRQELAHIPRFGIHSWHRDHGRWYRGRTVPRFARVLTHSA